MAEKNRLVEGNITETLVKLAFPIMGTSFVEMAYSMMDMAWLGRVGTNAVAAAGTAGFFTWIGASIFLIPKIGAEIGVAQSYGRQDMEMVRKYVSNAIQFDIIIALLYTIFLITLRSQLIGFFDLSDPEVISMAMDYLVIVSIGMVFFFLNPVFSGIFNGAGNSKSPFKINAIGLIVNMILDPMMILGLGPFPVMGVKGAALATIISQFIVTLIFIKVNTSRKDLFSNLNLFQKPELPYIKKIFKLGFPAALQNGIFAFMSMVITKILAQWGSTPIAVQNVGAQIESISWMTAGGFSTALSAFVGQNYGAGEWDRIHEGYKKAMGIVSIVGIFATCLLIFGATPLFKIFIPDDIEAIKLGTTYLRILGISQFFMCVEIATGGAFNGLGRTVPPSVVGIVLNALRIPGALLLSSKTSLGLNGVWWSISISSILKGIVLTSWFILFLKKNPEENKKIN